MRTPLLLLHGFPLDARMWRPLVERFQHERVVVTPNASQLLKDTDQPSISAMAAAAIELLDATAPGARAVVIGLSMGGYIAMEIAAKYPDRIAGLLLADTRTAADSADARTARDAMISAVAAHGVLEGTASLRSRLLSPNASDHIVEAVSDIVADQDPDVIVACLAAMRDRRDTTDVLRDLASPLLVVRGKDDALIPAEEAAGMASTAREGEYVEIRRAGHLPPMEYPFGFNAALTDFLRGLPS